MLDAADKEHRQDDGPAFQRVLMSSLVTVEQVLVLVLQSLKAIRIQARKINPQLLPDTAHSSTQIEQNYSGKNSRQDHIAILRLQRQRYRRHCFATETKCVLTEKKTGDFQLWGTNLNGKLSYPQDICIWKQFILVSNDYSIVQIHKHNGTFYSCLGKSKSGKARGEFNHPHGILVIDDWLYVCDTYNHRIQAFRWSDSTSWV